MTNLRAPFADERYSLFQIKKGETRINVISALPNDALTAFHQVQQLGMTGEGWVWLASAKVVAASLKNEPTLQEALNGLVGLTVKKGSGAKYLDLLVKWSEKDQGKYPGVIWSHNVSFLVQCSNLTLHYLTSPHLTLHYLHLTFTLPSPYLHLTFTFTFTLPSPHLHLTLPSP